MSKQTGRRAERKRKSSLRERSIKRRLSEASRSSGRPVFGARRPCYEVSQRCHAVAVGGIGLVHNLARRLRLGEAIDRKVRVLKRHLPYHESDHVMNIAYNVLCGGTCLEDIELLRTDEAYLNTLGAASIPDPTTAGDFCRRLKVDDIEALMDGVNETRLKVWRGQPDSFREEAYIDVDSTFVTTTGGCKRELDLNYKGGWGYHPLLVSLANTNEPLYVVNRKARAKSEAGAAEWLDKAIDLCRRAGFRNITLRGDRAFSQTKHLDRWDEANIRVIFGLSAQPSLKQTAQELTKNAWREIDRPPKYVVKTKKRRRRRNIRQEIVEERGYPDTRLVSEAVAEIEYKPVFCKKTYRVVITRQTSRITKGQTSLFESTRYFFLITNERDLSAEDIVFLSHDRCRQENLIEQLKNGTRSLRIPSDSSESNWAYMVSASLAWSLKAWLGLMIPNTGRWKEQSLKQKGDILRMRMKRFINAFIRIPAQVLRSERRTILRLLNWNSHQITFLRIVDLLERPLLC